MRTLVLSQNMMPIGSIDWRRAIVLMFEGKVEVIEEYDKEIKSVSLTVKMPAVVRLLTWIKHKLVGVRFNKANVYLRDKGRCQYCGIKIHESKATYDHVLPKSRGGKTDWDNIVISCSPCNVEKDSKTPEEAGMHLLSKPQKPKSLPIELNWSLRSNTSRLPNLWKNYILKELLNE